MIYVIFQTFYLLLPAYLANMAPVIFGKLKCLRFSAKPIDGGQKLGQDFIFGSSKTWRGLITAVIFGMLAAGVQAILYSNYYFFYKLSFIDYRSDWLWFGALAGLGAILGDLIKSFFKRRVGIHSGGVWLVFDQLDFIVGFFIAVWIFFKPSLIIVIIACLMTLVLHPLTNIIAYLLKFKKVWW